MQGTCVLHRYKVRLVVSFRDMFRKEKFRKLTLLYSFDCDQERDSDTLPKREEQDALDAEELGYLVSSTSHRDVCQLTDWPEWLEIGRDADPEHGQAAVVVSLNSPQHKLNPVFMALTRDSDRYSCCTPH